MKEPSRQPSYLMPAEWERHSAVWLSWPYDEKTFPNRVEKVEKRFVEIIKAMHQGETVELLVLDEAAQSKIFALLHAAGVNLKKVHFHITDYADVWLRDTGPIFVKDKNNKLLLTKWLFNAWGNKFPDLLKDNTIPQKISEWTGLELLMPQIIIEGGAIEVNGEGVCLTTEECLLNQNRNPGRTKKEIERFLADYLGIQKTIWLKQGLLNDHTDGHIDELARFVAVNTIVCAYEDDPTDGNYRILKSNYETLQKAVNLKGKPFELIKLPMPHLNYEDGEKAPASYTNFYIGNKVVLTPAFNDPNDNKALDILQDLFPDQKVVNIDCTDIIYGGGTIHCMTQQQPAV